MRTGLTGPAVVRAFGIAAGALVLAACTSGGGMNSVLSSLTPAKTTEVPAQFAKTPDNYCPPVVIRGSTESMTIYERGKDGDAASVRYLASISKTARECRTDAGMLSIKLGVSGRVVAGPKGGAGSITLPVRIVAVKQIGGAKPLFSQLYKIPVTLGPPDFGANYSQVFDQITIPIGPEDRDIIIYVGFDEGPAKKTS